MCRRSMYTLMSDLLQALRQGQAGRRSRTRTNGRARRARRDCRGPSSTDSATVLPTTNDKWMLGQNQVGIARCGCHGCPMLHHAAIPPYRHTAIPPLCGLMYMHVWSDVCGLPRRVLGAVRCNATQYLDGAVCQCTRSVGPARVKKGSKTCEKKHIFRSVDPR